jgi:hypothetical protein
VAAQSRAARPAKAGTKPLVEAHEQVAYRSIALTLVVTFALSFGFLYHKQRAAVPAASAPAAPAVSVQEAPPPPSLPPQAAPPRAIAREQQPVARPVARSIVPAAEPTPVAEEPSTESIPVQILMRRERRGSIEGTAQNMSEDPMTLTLISSSVRGVETGRITLTLGPSEKQAFGTDEGMELHSGEKILAQAQGYQDREARVP